MHSNVFIIKCQIPLFVPIDVIFPIVPALFMEYSKLKIVTCDFPYGIDLCKKYTLSILF